MDVNKQDKSKGDLPKTLDKEQLTTSTRKLVHDAQSLQDKSLESNQDLDTSNKPINMKSLYLDDLFGFNEARKRLEEQTPIEVTDSQEDFIPHQVFLNHIDSYHGNILAKFLTEQIIGGLISETNIMEGELEEESEYGGEIEEEELPEQVMGNQDNIKSSLVAPHYEIIGTVKNRKKYSRPSYIKNIIHHPSKRDLFLPELMKCGFVIYDISMDKSQIKEAHWALKAIEAECDKQKETLKEMNRVRTFVLISPILTWAYTKPQDPDYPVLALTETDYRKRKPHKNFKDHCALEKEVIQTGRKYMDIYRTLVIASGVTYGGQENILNYLFKKAWLGDSALQVFGPGNNLIPLISVQDLASILHTLLEFFPTKIRYIVAAEPRPSKLYDIVQSISRALGTGRVKRVRKEEAFLDQELTQEVFDALTMNINIEPAYIFENMKLKWKSNYLFPENIPQLVRDYKEAHQLEAIKIFLHGPPAVGKDVVAKQLCEYYEIHYVNVEGVIQHAYTSLKAELDEINEKKNKEEEAMDQIAEYGGEWEENENIEDMNNTLLKLERNTDGNIEENLLLKLFKERLLSPPCQNQGYVLDDYPHNIQQAQSLFETKELLGEDTSEDTKNILPDFVISLEANDDFLCNRVMGLSQDDAEASNYTEENMVQRLADFRKLNKEDTTILNFFDEQEIHPLLLNVMDDDSPQMWKTVQTIINKIGPPKTFGHLTDETAPDKKQQLLATKLEMEEKRKKRMEKDKQEHEILNAQWSKMEDWARLQNVLKQEEDERLALQALPLRHYLMHYVLPTLTRGLIDVAKLRPSDPVDYLAEYLFRENPEGKMFQPDYVTAAEDLMNAVQQFQDTLTKIHSLTDIDTPEGISQTSQEFQKNVHNTTEQELHFGKNQSEAVGPLLEAPTPHSTSTRKLE